MRLQNFIGDLYVSFIQKDWVRSENILDKYFSIVDTNSIPEYNRRDYSVSEKYESLLLYNYSFSCFQLNKYEKAERLALRGLEKINYEFQYNNKIYGYDLCLRLETLVQEIRNRRRLDGIK